MKIDETDRGDTTLASTAWAIEVILVSFSAQHARHGRDIETEQPTADGSKAADGVHVVERLLHG